MAHSHIRAQIMIVHAAWVRQLARMKIKLKSDSEIVDWLENNRWINEYSGCRQYLRETITILMRLDNVHLLTSAQIKTYLRDIHWEFEK